ncbi:DUF6218 family protein [Actinophytocola sp.]|uniref:DUF6218 family protein n=1 Tax=Actinophytocola sp. TaxID=1872138 RepID=UPI002D80F06A|nr:DUF6218 family protein [Actinophytocola sp.]HET9138758.1 DUF6218 family protein [Actinophytocola sp.]
MRTTHARASPPCRGRRGGRWRLCTRRARSRRSSHRIGHDGAEALAVWTLGPTGYAGGAWVTSINTLEQEPDRAARVLAVLSGRCLVDWDTDRPATIMQRIGRLFPTRPGGSQAAGTTAGLSAAGSPAAGLTELVAGLAGHVVTFPDLLDEIVEHRQRYTDAVEQHRRATNSKIAPLSWGRDIPADTSSVRSMLTGRRINAASAVAAQALGQAAVLQQIAELWQDTEIQRYRRPYLRALGEPQQLPPRWSARLRAVAPSYL